MTPWQDTKSAGDLKPDTAVVTLDYHDRLHAHAARLERQRDELREALEGAPFPGGGGGPHDLSCQSVFANAVSVLHVEGHHTLAQELQSIMKSQDKALANLNKTDGEQT